ncbi:MAG: polysaccharide deacetylase family protein [Treponema sp.]|nr:polysaccharide deacetylase family protein [Treponema sp.]
MKKDQVARIITGNQVNCAALKAQSGSCSVRTVQVFFTIFCFTIFSLIFAGCSHLSSIYGPNDYSLNDLKIDTNEARGEVINGYNGYAGKVIKVSPINTSNWTDYSRTLYWDWDLQDTGFQQITVTMSVLVESPNSGKAQTSAYRPAQKTAAAPSTIKWNGPANLGWTLQLGDDYTAQFGGKPVQIEEGKWVDLVFSQSVDITGYTGGQVYLDGHSDQQGLIDQTIYVRNFKVTMRPVTKFIAMTFNDSPSDFTEVLLDQLDQLDIKGTFFILGASMDAMHPVMDRNLTAADRLAVAPDRKETVKRIFDDGHELGLLTYFNASTDPALTENDLQKELEDTRTAVQRAIYGDDYMNHPWVANYIRDPNDNDPQTLAILKRVSQKMGLPIVSGTTYDSSVSPDTITDQFVSNLQPWDVSINKDPRSDPSIMRTLNTLVPRVQTEGYIFVTVSEMIDKRRMPLILGDVYTNMNPDVH